MRAISTKTHGVIDCIFGLLLIASPWIFGFAKGGLETWWIIITGAAIIFNTLITNYEAGAFKVIPMTTHLWIDGFTGALLLLSPWIFGFRDLVVWPHVIFGIIGMGTALITDPRTQTHITQ
jgi:hypothetical protein